MLDNAAVCSIIALGTIASLAQQLTVNYWLTVFKKCEDTLKRLHNLHCTP